MLALYRQYAPFVALGALVLVVIFFRVYWG